MTKSQFVVFSVLAAFAGIAIANETTTGNNVVERKTCDQVTSEIAELSAISNPGPEISEALTKLRQQQRNLCQKRAGTRSNRTIAATRAHIAPTTNDETDTPTEPIDKTCDTPDENGCCPGETYTDMGDLGFNCCPESGGDCFPPMPTTTEETTETEDIPELTDEERVANINAGLCADGTKPNKFGCCGDEIFKQLNNSTIFACCPRSGGDCFPPIK